ncbi:GNAT family N-acetyltransferase [Actinoplanes sp. NPDC049802]|uniref:GNAT family N-acetyltransferase n=1 Tax=Actinoplanes sp. NPDC049802 TaxID=3154742 RepID=UPI0033E47504
MPQPTLYTERMVLLPLTDEHLELEVELDADPEVLRYIDGRARTPEEVAEYHARRMELGRRVDGLGYWVAAERTGEFAGVMMLPPAERPGEAELGYRLPRRQWGRGLAAEAAAELLRHGFTTAGQERIIAQTMTVNAGSRRVMEKCGLRHVRTFFPDYPPIPGSDEGEVEYAITRAEWRARALGAGSPPRLDLLEDYVSARVRRREATDDDDRTGA